MYNLDKKTSSVKFLPVPKFKESPLQFIYCIFCKVYWKIKEYKKLKKYSVSFVFICGDFDCYPLNHVCSAINALERNGIENIYQLKKIVESNKLIEITGIGRKKYTAIRSVLKEFLEALKKDENSYADCKLWKYKKKQKKELKRRGRW